MATGHTETTGSTDTIGVNMEDYFDKVIKKVSYKWDDLARKLGFERGEIEAIRATESLQGPDKKCREVLERWQNRNGTNATLQVLQQALIDIEERRTAEELHGWMEKTRHSLKTTGQEMKTTGKVTMETVDGLRVELQKEQYPAAKGTGQSAKGLTPTFEKLRNHLQDRYRRELARIRPLPWCEDFYLNLEHMFTTLEMVRRYGIKEDCTVEAANVFQPHNHESKVPKTIRVEGDPGIGKTTLCYKIVYDCSADRSKFQTDNKFSSFKLVLYVELRKVPHNATDVKSTIFQQVFPAAYYRHEEEFWSYVECNPEKVLFVLDGLDEMPEETREKLKIAEFIRGQIIPDIHVIVTSRPYHCNHQLTSCDRHFVIKGYSRKNIESYINKHPKLDSNSRDGMLKQLQENESLHQLTENPLNLALLCILWQEDWNNAILPQTLTGLYSLLVLAIVKRYAKKCPGNINIYDLSLEEMPELIQAKLNHLRNLAWEGIREDRLHFSENVVEGVVETGFLTKDLNLTTLIHQPFWFQFLHKTFQEYFAAGYLHSLCEESSEASSILNGCVQNNTFIKYLHSFCVKNSKASYSHVLMECVQDDRYQQVLKFLAGLLGTNAHFLFEAFHNSLSTNQDDRIVSLCLECLHECEAGTQLAKYVSVLFGDWCVGRENHFVKMMVSNQQQKERLPCISSRLTCKTNMSSQSSHTLTCLEKVRRTKYVITSNEALYGLVHLLYHQAKQPSSQDNPHVELSSFSLEECRLVDHSFQGVVCRFLRAVSSKKVFSSLSVELEVGIQDAIIEEVCNLLQSDAYRDLTCDFKLLACENRSSSLDNLSKLLSSVQSETRLNLVSYVYLAENLNVANQSVFSEAVSTILRLGSKTREWIASVELYIDCASDAYVPGFASSSLTNIVMTIKQSQYHSLGILGLLFNVENLPLAEKPAIQSQLADISSMLENRNYIFRIIDFECSCDDGSLVNSGTTVQSSNILLRSLTANQSLIYVSLLCDGEDNVAECLHEVFARNRTLRKLEISFRHPVDDETMANIFSSYPVDNQSPIKSFSVFMETRLDSSLTDTTGSNCHSYEQTIRAILYICKNLGEGSALQRISFISGLMKNPEDINEDMSEDMNEDMSEDMNEDMNEDIMISPEDIMMKIKETEDKVSKVTPVCPSSLLKPLVEAIVDSQLIVNLDGIIWEGVTDLHMTDEDRTKYANSVHFRESQLGLADNAMSIRQLITLDPED